MGTDALKHIAEMIDSDPELQREYDRLEPRFRRVSAMIEARTRAGLSQTELARRMGVPRSTVLRLESLDHEPRLETLRRACEVLGCRLDVRIVPERQQRKSA